MAVEREGLSRNAAARRFGVAISTAINWLRRHQETGSVAPNKMGEASQGSSDAKHRWNAKRRGHKPRKLIGKPRRGLLEHTKTDFTLRGLRAELAALSAEEGGIKSL